MEEVLRIGPLALPLAPLQLFAAWWLGDALAQRRAARSQQIWGWHGWLLLVCGLLAARAAFVLEFAPHYAQPAWAAFDIRDGGWTASVGTIAVLLYGATLWLRRHPLAPAAMVGIAGALALWFGAPKLKYVPEQDTDFIFCTVGEEQGFVGSTIVILLFAALIWRLIYLAERQSTRFGRVYGYSVLSIFFFHLFVNVGMVLGLTPVIGIPLPFFSYGGSSLWGFTILLFVFLRIDAARES